ncbi:MAG TPA: hypothetical protein VH475_12095 [Tepidisphaeraceae bacterium]
MQPFDDPALKAALRRVLGQDAAPPALRDRIRAITVTTPGVGESPATVRHDAPIPLFRRQWFRTTAAAAVLLIGLGVLAFQILNPNKPGKGYAFPNSLYKAMDNAHQARLSGSASPDAVTALASANALASQLGRPVFAPDLSKDGWSFQGAAVRKVGGEQAAQLFFTKGKSSLSVFSLPASAVPQASDGSTYAVTFSGTPIAGIVSGKGLYCIVGTSPDGSLQVDEVKRLLDAHQADIAKS